MPLTTRARQQLFWSSLIFGLCTLIALLSAVGAYVYELGQTAPVHWGPLLRQEFKNWYACGLLSLGVLWLCRRNRLEPGRTGRWLIVHSAAGILFSTAYALLASWLVAGEESVMHPGRVLTFSYLVQMVGVHYCVTNFIMYWFVVLAHLGWHFYQRYRQRELEAAQLQRELTEARLDALRMQLNPHFLFNTLHAVAALMHENVDAAERVVTRLSELLRLSLDQSKGQEVPLSEELGFLDRYLEIEQTRFGERLRVEKQIEPAATQAFVPYLILQPLVENAIHHGIEPREDQGRVAIEARRNNGRLELRVSDNGDGFSSASAGHPREGIGLSNTRSRLRHLYGADFQLELAEISGGGMEARINIPFHTRTDANGCPTENQGHPRR